MAKNMGSHLARLQKVQIFDVNASLILNTSLAASRSLYLFCRVLLDCRSIRQTGLHLLTCKKYKHLRANNSKIIFILFVFFFIAIINEISLDLHGCCFFKRNISYFESFDVFIIRNRSVIEVDIVL